MSRIISGTLVTLVAAFSIAFAYLLFQITAEINTVASFLGSASALMYLSVEGIFLGLVISGAYFVLRRRD